MNSKEKGKINKHIKSFSHYSIINSKIPKSIIGLKALTKNDINKKNNFNIYQNNNMKLLNKKLIIKKNKEITEPNLKQHSDNKYADLFFNDKIKKNNILIDNFSQEEKIMNNSVNINNINLINSMNNITFFESIPNNKKNKNKNITVNKKISLINNKKYITNKTKNPFKELNYKSFGINFAVKELKQNSKYKMNQKNKEKDNNINNVNYDSINLINVNKLSLKKSFPYNLKLSPNSASNIFSISQKKGNIININKSNSEEKALKKKKTDSIKKLNRKIKISNILSPKTKKNIPDFAIKSPSSMHNNKKMKINEIKNMNNSFEKIEVNKNSFMKNFSKREDNNKNVDINITGMTTRNNNHNSFFKEYHQKSWTDSAEKIKAYSNLYHMKEKQIIKSVRRKKAKNISSKIIYNKKQLSMHKNNKKELYNDININENVDKKDEKFLSNNLDELTYNKDTNLVNTYFEKPSSNHIYKKPDISCINNSFSLIGKKNNFSIIINKENINNKVSNNCNFIRKYYSYFVQTKNNINNNSKSPFYISKKRIYIITQIKKIPNKSIYYMTKTRKMTNKNNKINHLQKTEKGLKLLERIVNKRISFFSLLTKNNDNESDLRENLNIITINNYNIILNKISDLILSNKKITVIIKNQNVFIEMIINKAIKEKIFIELYSKLCKDLFISLMTKIDNKNNDIDLFDKLTKEKSLKNLLKEKIIKKLNIYNEELKYLFYFICNLLENKIFSIKTGFDMLDILFKNCNTNSNDIYLIGIELLLTKINKIIHEKNKVEHIQRYNKYIKIYLLNIFQKRNKKNDLPNYLYYRLYNILHNENNNNKNKNTEYFNEKMKMIKSDLNEIININNNKIDFSKLNKKYETEINTNKTIELWEFLYYYVEACIDLIDSEKKIKLANEYLNNIITNLIISSPNEILEIMHFKLISLFLSINEICVDNVYMHQIMGYLLYILINNKLFYIKDLNNFLDKENYIIINIAKVVKYTIIFSEKNAKKFHNDFKQTKLFFGSNIFYNLVTLPLKKQYYSI